MAMDKETRTGLCRPICLSMHDTPSRDYLLLTCEHCYMACLYIRVPLGVVNIFTCVLLRVHSHVFEQIASFVWVPHKSMSVIVNLAISCTIFKRYIYSNTSNYACMHAGRHIGTCVSDHEINTCK